LCLVFLKDTLAIVEEDMKTYGPFKEGERTNIPLRNAEILISDGLALSWYGYELALQKYCHEPPDASEKPSFEELKP
jgi:hypothetical protein